MAGRDTRAWVEYAARLMHEQAIDDANDALRRAARALGQSCSRMPPSEDVRAALQRRLNLFKPDNASVLSAMRRAALDAMEFLAEFKPRVLGSVVEGAAQSQDRIRLLCECETPDVLAHRLIELRIPARQRQHHAGSGEMLQSFEFKAGAFDFELLALPARHQARRSQSLNTNQLRRLLASFP